MMFSKRPATWLVLLLAGILSATDAALLPSRAAAQGDTCADPIVVVGLPFDGFGTTCAFRDDYGEACPAGDTSPDVVYEYTPTIDMCVEARLCSSFPGFDFKLYVYSSTSGDCPAAGAGDTAFDIACDDDRCAPHPRIVNLALERLVTYWFVVDSPGDNVCGTYHLEIEQVGLECPAVVADFVDRAIDRVEFMPGGVTGTKRLGIYWLARATATPDSIVFDCDIEIEVDGVQPPGGVLPETLRFHPDVPFPCEGTSCNPDGCGIYRRVDPFFDEDVAATCFRIRAIPGVVDETCTCSGFFFAMSGDLPVGQGSVVRVRLVPARGGVVDDYAGNDEVLATCCEPPVGVNAATWGHVKRLFR